MPPLPLTRFNQEDVLICLDRDQLLHLLLPFQAELEAKNLRMPTRSMETTALHRALLAVFNSPEALPERLHASLRAIEELAAPENAQLLAALFVQHQFEPDPKAIPEQLALQLWCLAPFDSAGLQAKKADLLPNPLPVAPPAQDPEPPRAPKLLLTICHYPRNKISHLPPEIIESINQRLYRRETYAQILEGLGEPGTHLNKDNLSRWKKTGYQLWLKERQRREDAQAKLQLALDIVRENENGKIHEAAQQFAALQICQLLTEFDPAALRQLLLADPQNYIRLINTLPKLSLGGVNCERQTLELAELKTKLEDRKHPSKRGLSPETLKTLQEQLRLM